MPRLRELPIRRPAVADQHAVVVSAEYRRRLREPPPRVNLIDRRLRCCEGPQPLQSPIDLPAGFVGGDDRASANNLAEGRIGRLGLARRAMQGAGDRAGGDRQAEAVAQESDDLAMRQPQLFVEDHDQGEGLRPELHRRGAQGIRRLPRVTPLHPPATRRAVTNPHVEAAHARHHHGQVFLILCRHARWRHGTGAVRTRARCRDRDDLVDVRRRRPVPMASVARTRSTSTAPWRWCGGAFRERGCLPFAGSTSQVEFVLQPLVLAPQLIAFALQSDTFGLRPVKLAPQPFNSRSLSRGASDRSGTSRLCQILERCTS